jgi:hypothetical protein
MKKYLVFVTKPDLFSIVLSIYQLLNNLKDPIAN